MIRRYFNYFYTPVYDITTAKLVSYEKLQNNCIEKLEIRSGDHVLCVGTGTGNEIVRIYKYNPEVDIIAVDYSPKALERAVSKVTAMGNKIKTQIMDVHKLDFESESYDKVLCIHVTDFLVDHRRAMDEILRVLKTGGRFVITYPSSSEGICWGLNLYKLTARQRIKKGTNRLLTILDMISQIIMSLIYVPLLFRKNRKCYKLFELRDFLNHYTTIDFHIDEDTDYRDFIVYGTKNR